MRNFSITRDGQSMTAATTTNPQALSGAAELVAASEDVMIYNPGPSVLFVKAGAANVQATALSMPVPGGTLQAFWKGNASHIDAIVASGTQAFTVFVGEGQ